MNAVLIVPPKFFAVFSKREKIRRLSRHPGASEVLGTRKHFGYFNGDILDDHYYFKDLRIPALDMIDFDFAAWHTPADTLDKVSAESLQTVGQATLYYLCKAAPDLR